jgi:hypothetical protein
MSALLTNEITIFVTFQIPVFCTTLDAGVDNIILLGNINNMSTLFTDVVTIFIDRQIVVVMITVITMDDLRSPRRSTKMR